ncbi:hypothetical protein ATCV1_z505L [Acanthocystis turfacea chlorella virus 1]|uniref:Uncharacterized protein z505L n=1 Tax=Chlorovirus heliozoae TaxID=322019 RepID=A7K9B5_9PHYC|nr:hypothetical protein ATCV1_z505L [Acanthocystis turfacea chlorella virus 1]ABT16639.1 hypothetical protein ATCV1_z505L [Acanthocystis turfacea chlorella virus 1]
MCLGSLDPKIEIDPVGNTNAVHSFFLESDSKTFTAGCCSGLKYDCTPFLSNAAARCFMLNLTGRHRASTVDVDMLMRLVLTSATSSSMPVIFRICLATSAAMVIKSSMDENPVPWRAPL